MPSVVNDDFMLFVSTPWWCPLMNCIPKFWSHRRTIVRFYKGSRTDWPVICSIILLYQDSFKVTNIRQMVVRHLPVLFLSQESAEHVQHPHATRKKPPTKSVGEHLQPWMKPDAIWHERIFCYLHQQLQLFTPQSDKSLTNRAFNCRMRTRIDFDKLYLFLKQLIVIM